MATLIQATCLLFLIGMAHSWLFPAVVEERLPVTYVHTSIEEGSSSSLLDEMNRMMAAMHEQFEHMFNWPSSYPLDPYEDGDYDLLGNEDRLNPIGNLMNNAQQLPIVNDLTEIRKRLDSMEPVCTTITDSPATISPRKSRRKKLRATQTTTCVKELIVNGQKHIFEEVKTVDDKGLLIKQSSTYDIMPIDADQNQQ